MARNFLQYVWMHSARAQIIILILTAAFFPFLYLTLELPKQIINDAIGGKAFPVTVLGYEFDQISYLVGLSFAYLFMVLASGLLKMKTNTYKGIVGERMLRRFRFELVRRIIRFPLPYFKQTSQGSLMSMLTAESEAVGSMMGEAFATPVFAAGQMATILVFLFVQNIWLGLAAVAMIPVQAYIVPRMQKRVNALNRERILEVRKFSEYLGDTVKGAEDIRNNGGIMYTLASFARRFALMFELRFEVYQRKFFMKFVNNTLNQLTPFYLLLVGGYLVINGQLTIGALAAALSSYKDLLGPWRELLAYYSQIQETNLRYRTIIDRFDPPGMIDEELFFGRVAEQPDWRGTLELKSATVADQYGSPIIASMSACFPAGSYIAIQSDSFNERQAMVRALSRSILLTSGSISIDGVDLASVHQDVIARQIGVLTSEPGLFGGSIEHNTQISMWRKPPASEQLNEKQLQEMREAMLTGNSAEIIDYSWLDIETCGFEDHDDLRAWWASIIREIGLETYFLRQSLASQLDLEKYGDLARTMVQLRERVHQRLKDEKLESSIYRFDYEKYNPALTVIENVIFGIRSSAAKLVDGKIDPQVWSAVQEMGVAEFHQKWSFDMLDVLVETFSSIGSDHPMFQRLENVSAESFKELQRIYQNRKRGEEISGDDLGLVLALPLNLTAEELGEGFPDALRGHILSARRNASATLYEKFQEYYFSIDEKSYIPTLSVIENILFGKIRQGADGELVSRIVVEELEAAGIAKDVLLLIGDVQADHAGSELDKMTKEAVAFARAVIKRPKILVLDKPFSSAPPEVRSKYYSNIRRLLPQATVIELDSEFNVFQPYDKRYEIRNSRLLEMGSELGPETEFPEEDGSSENDLGRKVRILSQVELLSKVDRSQIRLLAFGARWIEMPAGKYFFRKGDAADGAYIFTSGIGELLWPTPDGHHEVIGEVKPGILVGDLAVIMKKGRTLDLVAKTDIVALRIDKQVLTDVIENDAGVATSLLRTVAGYLQDAGQRVADRELEIRRLSATGRASKGEAQTGAPEDHGDDGSGFPLQVF